MSDDHALTIALEGEVPLEQFAEVIGNFSELIRQLSKEIAGKVSIDWVIEDLHAGSASATVIGISPQSEAVERVVQGYLTVGRALQYREAIPYSAKVREKAFAIRDVIDGKITSVRFESPSADYVISKGASDDAVPSLRYSLGAVAGMVETLNRRNSLRFVLYDPIFDRSITCYVREGQEAQMREIWGQRVVVMGRVGRESERGRPVNVRDITDIRLQAEGEPQGYRAARGILAWTPNDELPEVAVRRLRDAED